VRVNAKSFGANMPCGASRRRACW